MRWRIDVQGKTEQYVDADKVARGRGQDGTPGTLFIRNGATVFMISADVGAWVSYTPVPSLRLVGGPRTGQVGPASDPTPQIIHFQYVVPLNELGAAIAPVPPQQVRGLDDAYVHHPHPMGCPCGGNLRGAVEHVYVWPPDVAKQVQETEEMHRG